MGAVQGGFQESENPLKKSLLVYTVPCKNSNSHKVKIPQLPATPRRKPLKEGMNCVSEGFVLQS